jgi:hypothetical protein
MLKNKCLIALNILKLETFWTLQVRVVILDGLSSNLIYDGRAEP